MTCRLSVLAISAVALLGAHPAFAQQWTYVSAGDNAVFGVDQSTIRRDGASRTGWTIMAYKAPQSFDGGPKYDFSLTRTEFDCQSERERSFTVTDYSFSASESVESTSLPGSWSYPVPGSIGWRMLEFVCSDARSEDFFDTPRAFAEAARKALLDPK